MPVGYPEVGIGVYSEALEICTCEARVRLLRSILEAGEQVVEFDSDLYDQWAGEVTTLLTDDAFDAESTRPVQNAVLTAWKDTVPLDSALVHNTGDETVAGRKRFTTATEHQSSIATIRMISTQASTVSSWKADLQFQDQVNGASSIQGRIASGTYPAGGYEFFTFAVKTPSRNSQYAMDFRSFENHAQLSIPPYYPVNSGGNPVPLSDGSVMTSGNVAVDPRIVHTSGVETIAGEKTLLTAPVVSASESGIIFLSDRSESSNQRITTLKFADATNPRGDPLSQFAVGRTAQYNYVISYLKKGTTSHSVTFRAHADHMDVAVTPYYPVDGSGNPQALTANALVASGNIAVDPRIVHTTGNQTVAGVKTFTNGIDAYPQNWHDVNKNGQAMGQYCIFATIPASTDISGKFVQVDFVQSSNGGSVAGRMMFKVRLDGPDAMWVYRKSKGGNANINADAIHIVSDGTNLYLVSKRVSTYGMLKCRVGLFIDYGTVQSVNTGVTFHPQADMTILDSLDGYTDLGIQEP